jgi:hypothetical protein
MQEIKIITVGGIDIMFEIESERFLAKGENFRSLYEAKKWIERYLEEKFEGEYLIFNSWDGIIEFEAKSRALNSFDGKYYINGICKEKNGNQQKSISSKLLFPKSEFNLSLKKKEEEMDSEGWALIHKSKLLGNQLKK